MTTPSLREAAQAAPNPARVKFEAWAKEHRKDLDLAYMYDDLGRYHHDGYIWKDTDDAFCIWTAALAQPEHEPVCRCNMRTRLVGDGCAVCNPALAAELAGDEQASSMLVTGAGALEDGEWVSEAECERRVADAVAEQRRTIDALMVGMPDEGTTPVIRRIAWLEAECQRRVDAALALWPRDCRTCAHFTTKAGGCTSVVQCVDSSQFKATAPRQYWIIQTC